MWTSVKDESQRFGGSVQIYIQKFSGFQSLPDLIQTSLVWKLDGNLLKTVCLVILQYFLVSFRSAVVQEQPFSQYFGISDFSSGWNREVPRHEK